MDKRRTISKLRDVKIGVIILLFSLFIGTGMLLALNVWSISINDKILENVSRNSSTQDLEKLELLKKLSNDIFSRLNDNAMLILLMATTSLVLILLLIRLENKVKTRVFLATLLGIGVLLFSIVKLLQTYSLVNTASFKLSYEAFYWLLILSAMILFIAFLSVFIKGFYDLLHKKH